MAFFLGCWLFCSKWCWSFHSRNGTCHCQNQ